MEVGSDYLLRAAIFSYTKEVYELVRINEKL